MKMKIKLKNDPPKSIIKNKNSNTNNIKLDKSELFIKYLNYDLGIECDNEIHSYVSELYNRDSEPKKYKKIYMDICYNLLGNLNPEGSINNTYLRSKVLNGEIKIYDLVRMKNNELFPEKWQQIKQKRLNEIKDENNMYQATTDLYKCSKCKKRKCTFYQMQTRSCDEPITTFITCVNCGKRWKE